MPSYSPPQKKNQLGVTLLISDKIILKGSLVLWQVLGMEQETYKVNLEHLIVPEIGNENAKNKTKQKLHKLSK